MSVKTDIKNLKIEIQKRIDHFGMTDKNTFENDFNRRGQNHGHWSQTETWDQYLGGAEKASKPDEEFELRKGSVLFVLTKEFIEWWLYKAKHRVQDVGDKKDCLQEIEDYIKNYQGSNEQAVYNDKSIKDDIDELKEEIKKLAKKTPKTSTGAGKGWESVGFCQRYLGNDPDELKKVGLGQRYYG